MQGISNENPLATMKAGSLLLKQESNGLHLRWIVLNSTNDTIYWLNPKKETLVIDATNSIPIKTITKVIIGPDFKQLIKDNQQSVLESLSVASFRIYLIAPDKQVDIYCPLYADFDIWVKGLVQLLPTSIFEQISITPEHQNEVDCITRGDPEALRLRLCELVELADSLLKESASLMEIRSRRDYCISILGNRLKRMIAKKQQGPDSTLPLNLPTPKPDELTQLREQNQRLQAILEDLERTDKSLDTKLRRQEDLYDDDDEDEDDNDDDDDDDDDDQEEEEAEEEEDDLADTNYTLSDTPRDADTDDDDDNDDDDDDDDYDDMDIDAIQNSRRTRETIAALESQLAELNAQRDALRAEQQILRSSVPSSSSSSSSSSRRPTTHPSSLPRPPSSHVRNPSSSSATQRRRRSTTPSSRNSSSRPNSRSRSRSRMEDEQNGSVRGSRGGDASYIPLTQLRSIISRQGRVTPTLQAQQQYRQRRYRS